MTTHVRSGQARIVPFPLHRHRRDALLPVGQPYPPDRLEGLFRLPDRRPVAITFDWIHGMWLVDDVHEMRDDIFTTASIYTFGWEQHKRLHLRRPAAATLALLREHPARVRPWLREFPPRSQVFEFGITPETEAQWQRLILDHQELHRNILDAIRSQSTPRVARNEAFPKAA
jgi:hypothetical protein